ncbi:MAG: 5-nucleotidase / UDP-sugar diphosphatase [Clostridiales bacterium]|nr:5-nucleotidase / UDP-sugar diphosphatase [Clostridiales bacterium]MDN5283182.1 5-nucleotidase / UDP-sugar diphosphatase [Candidatus Ozemobacter sp.]
MIEARRFGHARLLGIFLAFLLLLPISGLCDTAELLIFHSSDVHGNISAHPDPTAKVNPRPLMGGYAVLKKLMDGYRNQPDFDDARFFYFDSGDFFQGTPVVDRTRGKVMIDMLNRVGVDAVTLGNHEFDYTYPNLVAQMKKRNFHVVCCNVIEKATGKIPEFAEPYKVYSHNGFKIGLIGIDSPETPMMSIEKNVEDLIFLRPEALVKDIVNKMRRSDVDFIILLSHLGYDADLKFVESVEGIDLVLGGHSHTLLTQITRAGPSNTAIIHSGGALEHTSVISIKLNDEEKHEIKLTSVPLYLEKIGYDRQIAAIEDEYLKDIRKEMNREIGKTEVNLYRGVNGGDSTAGSLIADAMRNASNADFAFINFGGIRQPIFKGKLTVESIFLVQPFNNQIEILQMTGNEILDLIERSVSNPFVIMDDADKAYALEHFNIRAEGMKRVVGPNYGYLFPSNLKITFDPEKEPMNRVLKVERLDGEAFDPEKTYKVAVNDFMAGGGDGFLNLKEVTDRYKTGVLVRDAVIKLIEAKKVIEKKPDQRMFNIRLKAESLE